MQQPKVSANNESNDTREFKKKRQITHKHRTKPKYKEGGKVWVVQLESGLAEGGGEAKENELKRIILAEKEKSKREKKKDILRQKKKRDTIDKRKGVICWDNGEKYWMI